MPLVPKYSENARLCKWEGCPNVALHGRKRCFKHLPRTRFEHWLDLHNHKMELMRTVFAACAFLMQVIILILLLT
jgi:hypothetical protein